MSNPNVPQAQKTRFSVAISTPTYQELIRSTLSDPNRVRSFTAAITSAVAINPDLQACQSSTIIAAALLGESLNLSPSPQLGQYYLVPFEAQLKDADGKKLYVLDENGQPKKDKNGKWIPQKVTNAQFVLGYRGYLQLAIRSGYYLDIDATEIHAGEYKGRDRYTGKPIFEFIEDDSHLEDTPVIGYMAYFEYTNGFKKTLYWSKEKMLAHANTYSAAFSSDAYLKIQNNEIPQNEMWKYSSQWYKSFDTMAKKTMIRQLISKWGVMSADLQKAFESDSCVISKDDQDFTTTPIEQLQPEEQTNQLSDAPSSDEPVDTVKIDLKNV